MSARMFAHTVNTPAVVFGLHHDCPALMNQRVSNGDGDAQGLNAADIWVYMDFGKHISITGNVLLGLERFSRLILVSEL